MASLPSLPKPISQTQHFPINPARHSRGLFVVSRNHLFSGHGSLNFQHGSFGAGDMRPIRSSNRIKAVSGKFVEARLFIIAFINVSNFFEKTQVLTYKFMIRTLTTTILVVPDYGIQVSEVPQLTSTEVIVSPLNCVIYNWEVISAIPFSLLHTRIRLWFLDSINESQNQRT